MSSVTKLEERYEELLEELLEDQEKLEKKNLKIEKHEIKKKLT